MKIHKYIHENPAEKSTWIIVCNTRHYALKEGSVHWEDVTCLKCLKKRKRGGGK